MAKLDFRVGTGPEVDFDACPVLLAMHISEADFFIADRDGINGKSKRTHTVETEVLHSCVNNSIPIATEGSYLNLSANE